MKISRNLLIIAGVILVLVIVMTIIIRASLKKNGSSSTDALLSPTPITQTGQSFLNYKQTNPSLSSRDRAIMERVNGTLPYSSDNLDIDFEDEVFQYIVSKKNELADEEFKKWLDEKALDELYLKFPGLFAETDLPLADYIYLVEEFNNEPNNLPPQSQFDQKGNPGKGGSQKTDQDLNLLVDLMQTLLSFDLGTASPSGNAGGGGGGGGESSDLLSILPNPLPPISPKAFGSSRNWILENCPKNRSVYEEAQQKTGVAWQILAGIHYREGTCQSNRSLISGRIIGEPEPDNGGATYGTLLETAIAAANEFKGKIGGQPPNNFNELIAAAQRFHGTGGRNCGQTSAYKGPCPPPDGIDDPYPLNFFDEDHSLMYKIYCADHVLCNPPVLDGRHGVATIVRMLISNE